MIEESLLDGVALLSGLNRAARRELAARSVLLRKAQGEVLWRVGEPARGLVILLTGSVRLVRAGKGGRRHVIHREGPGVALGEIPLLDGDGYPATAEVETAVTAILVTPAALEAAMAADPTLARTLLRGLAHRVRNLIDRLDGLTTLDIRSRLARHVLDRADSADGAVFTLGAHHGALAEDLGTVREVLVRNLAKLRTQGLIVPEGRGRYRIGNRAALEALADR